MSRRIDIRIQLDAPDCPGLTHEELAVMALHDAGVPNRGIMTLLGMSAYRIGNTKRSARQKMRADGEGPLEESGPASATIDRDRSSNLHL